MCFEILFHIGAKWVSTQFANHCLIVIRVNYNLYAALVRTISAPNKPAITAWFAPLPPQPYILIINDIITLVLNVLRTEIRNIELCRINFNLNFGIEFLSTMDGSLLSNKYYFVSFLLPSWICSRAKFLLASAELARKRSNPCWTSQRRKSWVQTFSKGWAIRYSYLIVQKYYWTDIERRCSRKRL